jgi:metal-dependent amidase/aminoacylase/carboxypeptidase family protein
LAKRLAGSERRHPPTVNAAPETEIVATAAALLVGESNVRPDRLPSMGAEDLACFLEGKIGASISGLAGSAERGGMLHNPHYDFNDAILPSGASY